MTQKNDHMLKLIEQGGNIFRAKIQAILVERFSYRSFFFFLSILFIYLLLFLAVLDLCSSTQISLVEKHRL